MTPSHKPHRGIRWSAIALTALATTQAATVELDPVIVSALRVPQAGSTVTSSVTDLNPRELVEEGVLQLRDALNRAPGVIATSTAGQTGAVGGLFIRGTTTAESLMVVDGIRMNGSGNQLGNIFAAGRSYDIGNLEILRGPQAAVYGGESIGGVVWMETPRGCGDPTTMLSFEAGSFNSWSGYGRFEGGTDTLGYHLSGGYEESDNDAPQSHYHQGNTALRVEAVANDIWTLGTTFRALDAYYENGGGSDDRLDSTLTTLYATGHLSEVWTTRLTFGYQQEAYDSVSASGTYDTDLRAGTLSNDNEIKINDDLRLLVGGSFHRDSYKTSAFYQSMWGDYINAAKASNNRYGLHAAVEWDSADQLTHTAALRWEDYDSHGEELTWRVGSAWRPTSSTTLRGGIGTSFRAPTYLDLYYANNYGQTGNPNLDSQQAIGWDLGVEQQVGDAHTLEATWFKNLLDNAIDSYAFPMPVNIAGTTTTEGAEFAWRSDWLDDSLSTRIAWTWLHRSLKDQPVNAATANVRWNANDKAMVGIGATHLSGRSWGGDEIAAYTITRLFGSYQLTDHVKLHARIENALDEQYELSSFYGTTTAGAGTGVYAGLTIEW